MHSFNNLFGFFLRKDSKFWFLTRQIELVLRTFTPIYPNQITARGDWGDRIHPISYYDRSFAYYIKGLLDEKNDFLGVKPKTTTYRFLVGSFIRILWMFGSRRQVIPVVHLNVRQRRSPVHFESFYGALTPLAALFKIYYRLKFHFSPPTLLHYRLNPYFFFYAPDPADQVAEFDQPLRDHSLFTSHIFFTRGSLGAQITANLTDLVSAASLFIYQPFSSGLTFYVTLGKLWAGYKFIDLLPRILYGPFLTWNNVVLDPDHDMDTPDDYEVLLWPPASIFFQRRLMRTFGTLGVYPSFPLRFSSAPFVYRLPYLLHWPTPLRLALGLDYRESFFESTSAATYDRAWPHTAGAMRLANIYFASWTPWPAFGRVLLNLSTGVVDLSFERGFDLSQQDSRALYQLLRHQIVRRSHENTLRPRVSVPLPNESPFLPPSNAHLARLRRAKMFMRAYARASWYWRKADKRRGFKLKDENFDRQAAARSVWQTLSLRDYTRFRYFRHYHLPFIVWRSFTRVGALLCFGFIRPFVVLGAFFFGPQKWGARAASGLAALAIGIQRTNIWLYKYFTHSLIQPFLVFLRESFSVRPYFALFQNALAPLRTRLRALGLYVTIYDRYINAKRAFSKMHAFGAFTNWALADDSEADSPAELVLGEADVYYEPDDLYETDGAVLDNYDNSFPHMFLEGENGLITDDYDDYETAGTLNQNVQLSQFAQTRLLDRVPPSDFFQTDAHDREAHLTTTLLFHIFFPSFHHFFRRSQYEHVRTDFLAAHDELTEEPYHHESQFPLPVEDTELPVTGPKGVELIEWSTAYSAELNKWAKARSQHARVLPEFLRGTGSVLFSAPALRRISSSNWNELTRFADFLVTGVTRPAVQASLTPYESNRIWERLSHRLEQAPDVVFRRVMSAPSVPSAFKNVVLYPRTKPLLTTSVAVGFLRFLFGTNYVHTTGFRRLQRSFSWISTGWLDLQYHFRGDVRGLHLFQLYAGQYISASTLTEQFSRLPHSPHLFLAISRYLRTFAAEDFARFKEHAAAELPTTMFLSLFQLGAVARTVRRPTPQVSPFRQFLLEPSVRTFYDFLTFYQQRHSNDYTSLHRYGSRQLDELRAPFLGDQNRLLFPFFFLTNRLLSLLPLAARPPSQHRRRAARPNSLQFARNYLDRFRTFTFVDAPRFLTRAVPRLRETPVGPIPQSYDRGLFLGLREDGRVHLGRFYDLLIGFFSWPQVRAKILSLDWLTARTYKQRAARRFWRNRYRTATITSLDYQTEGWWRTNLPSNNFRTWGNLTPFWQAIQNALYDPFLVDAVLPSQFSWLHLESLWSWENEDMDDLDLYDEPLIYDEEGTFEGDEEVNYISAYDGQIFEQDTDNAPAEFGENVANHQLDHWLAEDESPDDFDNIGDDYMEEEAEDLDQDAPPLVPYSQEPPIIRFPASITEEYNDWFYEFDESVAGFEFWDEEEWHPDEFALAEDTSIPLARLFFGGLQLPGRLPATDPRLFLGPIAQAPRDANLHFQSRLNAARANAETRSLVATPGLPRKSPHFSHFRLFVKIPVISALIRGLVYGYLIFRDLVYTYIFFDLQMRPDYQRARLGLAAAQHYLRWMPLYGNKFHMQRFSDFVVDWLQDFEKYESAAARSSAFTAYKLFGYNFPKLYHSVRTTAYDRFFSAWPLVNLWYRMDRATPLNFELPSTYYPRDEPGHYEMRSKPDKVTKKYHPFGGQVSDTHPDVPFSDEITSWRPRLGQDLKPNLPARQPYYDREFFGYFRDMPTQHPTSSLIEYIDTDALVDLEGTYADSSPLLASPEPAEFMKQDDALFFSFSLDVDFEVHVAEFSSRLEVLLAAGADLWDIFRDYSLYGIRLGFNYCIAGPLYFWAVYADRFWLTLALRIGWWVNLIRYFLSLSFCLALFGYTVFLIPRLTYYWLSAALTSHILLLAVNMLIPLIVLFGSLYLLFSPVYTYFNSLSRFEWHGWFALIFFILFDHAIFGYERHGPLSFWAAVDWDEHPLMYTVEDDFLPFPARSSPTHMYDGPNPYLESTQTAYFTQAAMILFDLNQMGYYGRQRRPEHLARWGPDVEGYKGHNDFDFFNHRHLALSSIYDLFYFVKLYILKLKTNSLVGWKHTWQSDTDEEAMDAIMDEPYAVFHRLDSFTNLRAPGQTHEEYLIAATPHMLEQNSASPFLYPFWPEFGTAADGWYSRMNAPSPFSTRHRRYHQGEESYMSDPMPYDFRVKSFDHFFQPYVGYLGYPGRNSADYAAITPRMKNYFVRMPNFKHLTDASVFPAKVWEDNATSKEFFSWEPSQWAGEALEATYADNEDWDEIFTPPDTLIPGASQLFTQRRHQPAHFYKRNFGIYGYGDWYYRRQLLHKAYAVRRFNPSNFGRLQQYYHFARSQTSTRYFLDQYAKYLRDYLLYYKPGRAYAYNDIYGLSPGLRIALRNIKQFDLLVSTPQYGGRFGDLSRWAPYGSSSHTAAHSAYDFASGSPYLLGGETNEKQTRIRKLFQEGYGMKQQSTSLARYAYSSYLDLEHMAGWDTLRHPLARSPVRSRAERDKLLAVARTLRSAQLYDRLLRLNTGFSTFYLHQRAFQNPNDPKSALDWVLQFDASLIPVVSKAPDRWILEPLIRPEFHETEWVASHLSDAFHAPPMSKSANRRVGADLMTGLGRGRSTYDPIQLYELGRTQSLYAFPPGSQGHSRRFSFFFDAPEVYGMQNSLWAEDYMLDDYPDSAALEMVFPHEDRLDSFLDAVPATTDYKDLVAYTDRLREFLAGYPIFLFDETDLFDYIPTVYDSFSPETLRELRAHGRLFETAWTDNMFPTEKTLFGGDEVRRPLYESAEVGVTRQPTPVGIRTTTSRHFQFQMFADFLSTVADHNRVQSLDQVYFQDFLLLAKRGRLLLSDVLATGMGESERAATLRRASYASTTADNDGKDAYPFAYEPPPAAIRHLKRFSKSDHAQLVRFYADDQHYRNRWGRYAADKSASLDGTVLAPFQLTIPPLPAGRRVEFSGPVSLASQAAAAARSAEVTAGSDGYAPFSMRLASSDEGGVPADHGNFLYDQDQFQADVEKYLKVALLEERELRQKKRFLELRKQQESSTAASNMPPGSKA